MDNANRKSIIKQYDYMAALGPFLKQQFIEKDGINPEQLIDIGIARTDEIVKKQGITEVPTRLASDLGIDPKKPIVSYLPTFWGASSIYHTGKEIIRYWPTEYTLLFRPHPQTPKKILREYLKIVKSKPFASIIFAPEGRYANLSLTDVYTMSSAIIGDVSSVMLEAILTDKPLVFAYDTPANRQNETDYQAIKEVVDFSQSITPENVPSLRDIIHTALQNGVDDRAWSDTSRRTFFHNDGTSVQAIAGFVRSLIK